MRRALRPNARTARRGVTMVELMVAMVITAIFGVAAVKLFASQTRFIDQQHKARSARYVSRQSMNLLLSELRMVEVTGGVINGWTSGMTLRVPYALGLFCGTDVTGTTVSLMPADMYGNSLPTGYAWRTTSGAYVYDETGVGTLVRPGSAAVCTGQGITTPTNGVILLLNPPLPTTIPVASPIFLFQRVRYEFKTSAAIPGKRGLWRTGLRTGIAEEIAAPFDTTAQFRYFAQNADTSVASLLPSFIVGVDLILNGASEQPRWGATKPEISSFRTAVFFGNRQP